MKNIVLSRVDDRLIHGEVVSVWGPALRVNRYIIVDDEVAQNKLNRRVIKALCPESAVCNIYTAEKGAEVLMRPSKDKKERVMILAKSPITFLNLMELGCTFDEINLGGMGMHDGRSPFYKNLSCSEEEVTAIQSLIARGVRVYYQLVPEQKSADIDKMLTSRNL